MKTSKPSYFLSAAVFCLHAVIWLCLLIFKFNRIRRWVYRRFKRDKADPKPAAPVIFAVKRSSSYLPGATCLSEALCGYGALLFYGWKPQLVIGVERKGNNQLDAHAWIELEGKVVIGDNGNLHKYDVMKKKGQTS